MMSWIALSVSRSTAEVAENKKRSDLNGTMISNNHKPSSRTNTLDYPMIRNSDEIDI